MHSAPSVERVVKLIALPKWLSMASDTVVCLFASEVALNLGPSQGGGELRCLVEIDLHTICRRITHNLSKKIQSELCEFNQCEFKISEGGVNSTPRTFPAKSIEQIFLFIKVLDIATKKNLTMPKDKIVYRDFTKNKII